MSGPKYYNFPMGSAEEAAAVFSLLSSFHPGVSIRVENNQLMFTVSNNAWCAGATREAISQQIDSARRRFAESEEIKRILETRRSEEAEKITAKMKQLTKAYEMEKDSICEVISRCKTMEGTAQTKMSTPFGDYSLRDEAKRVENLKNKANSRLQRLEDEYHDAVKKCNENLDAVRSCRSIRELSAIQRRYNSLNISRAGIDRDADALNATLSAKIERLRRFGGFLKELYRNMQDEDLLGYSDRIRREVSQIDIFDEAAGEKIKGILTRIEAEIKELRLQEEKHRENDEIQRRVAAQLDALSAVSASLRPVAEIMDVSRVVRADYSDISQKTLEECDRLIAAIDSLEFKSGETQGKVDRLKGDLDNLRGDLKSEWTADALSQLQRELTEMEKVCQDVDDLSKRFKAEQEKYAELYLRLQGMMSGEQLGFSDEAAAEVFVNPADLVLVYHNPEEQIARLKELNAQLEAETMAFFQESFCNAIAVAVDNSNSGTCFKKEKDVAGAIHTTYVREDNKGVIFDVSCSTDGRICAAPRGVVLSNGKPTISPEDLRAVHSSCDWAEEMSNTFHSFGIPDLTYQEMPEEVKNSLYDMANYYQIETEEDSVLFLHINHYTEGEIADLMEISSQKVADILGERVAEDNNRPNYKDTQKSVNSSKK